MDRKPSRAVTWALVVAFGLVAVFAASQYRQARNARLLLESGRQRAFFGLVAHIENMEGSLAKALGSSTQGQQTMFLTSCWSHSQGAQESLSQLGMRTMDLSRMQKFIAQVGDFSLVLAQKLARGDRVTGAEWDELARMETTVKDLARALSETGSAAAVTGARFGMFALNAPSPTDESLFRGFSEIDTLIQSVPSPQYDGPFSDRALEARGLANPGPTITAEDAKYRALNFLTPLETFNSVRVENIEGKIPAYLVTAARGDGSEVSCSVAKEGGSVISAMDGKVRGAPKLDVEGARKHALDFLKSKAMTNLIETGWRKPGRNADRVVFTFAAVEQVSVKGKLTPVIVYPDMVKVEVALDNGEVIGFDQTGYLTNHIQRTFKSPSYDASAARRVLKEDLTVQGEPRLVVIPMVPAREVMAWEFRVSRGQDTYLVYVNAITGREEVVLQMVIDETGSMTM